MTRQGGNGRLMGQRQRRGRGRRQGHCWGRCAGVHQVVCSMGVVRAIVTRALGPALGGNRHVRTRGHGSVHGVCGRLGLSRQTPQFHRPVY